ncbi:serine hydrolase domain-containing protein [Pantoea sp. AS142]|uniref:serine hydrolase domain-containing protein n=1 Tax=Pantoea sp. AS142 TaxID=3081292 RepID=UPI0030187A69
MESLKQYFNLLKASLPSEGPGFSAAIIRSGQTIFELHHGMSSLELKVPLSRHSAYYLASESKQFTAACVLTLVREGLIGLDDDVCIYLPELLSFEQYFPLSSLLNHSSGIPDYFPYLHCQIGRHEGDYFNNETILKIITSLDCLEFKTASKYGYSNSNYILLAALVERLTGKPIKRYAQEVLFDPLGIQQLAFDDDRFAVIEHRVTSYEQDSNRPFGYRQNLANANTVGDGGIYGSISDLIKWEKEWHIQQANPSSILQSLLQGAALTDGTLPNYRFGLEVTRNGNQDIVFHSGCLWGFRTLILRFVQARVSVIHLANCRPARPDMERIISTALE